MNTIHKHDEYLTVKEVMEMAEISRHQLYRDTKSGKIQSVNFGKNVRYKRADAEEYAEMKKQSKKVQLWKEKKDITPPKS